MAILNVLPKGNDANAGDAPAILRHLIGEPVSVLLVILGRYADGTPVPDLERVLENAVGRAQPFPATRKVVLVPDPNVLEAETLRDIRRGSKWTMAATYGLRDTIAARLRIGEALDRFEVETAYVAAEEQGS